MGGDRKHMKKYGPKFFKLDANYKPRDPRHSTNWEHKKCEENVTQAHHDQSIQSHCDKGKIVKAARE